MWRPIKATKHYRLAVALALFTCLCAAALLPGVCLRAIHAGPAMADESRIEETTQVETADSPESLASPESPARVDELASSEDDAEVPDNPGAGEGDQSSECQIDSEDFDSGADSSSPMDSVHNDSQASSTAEVDDSVAPADSSEETNPVEPELEIPQINVEDDADPKIADDGAAISAPDDAEEPIVPTDNIPVEDTSDSKSSDAHDEAEQPVTPNGAGDANASSSEVADSALASQSATSGFWGTCAWEITLDGTLVISNGKGSDIGSVGDAPWYSARSQIKVVATADGVELPTDIGYMFYGCINLTSLDLSHWDTSGVTGMDGLFQGCSRLSNLDVSNWNTSSVTTMNDLFYGCARLASLDISSWDTSSVTTMHHVMYACSSLSEVQLGDGFVFVGSASLPSDTINGHADWYSTSTNKWYTASRISSGRSGIADTYTKLGLGSLANSTITLPKTSYDYTGSAIEPTPTVKLGGKTLKAGVDYTTKYLNNSNAGTASVIVTGRGSYIGSMTITFAIKAADLSKATVTLSPKSFVYNGMKRRPTVTVTYLNTTLRPGADYTISWLGGPHYGVLTAKITGKGSYTGSKSVDFRVNFRDTPTNAWYVSQGWIAYVVNAGVMTGMKNGSGYTGYFEPEGLVTRAQVAVVLYRYANPTSDATSNPARYGKKTRFSDVPRGQWHTAAIEWCAEQGIVTGYGNTGRFGPDDSVTREQLATMMYRFATSQGASNTAPDSALSKAPDAASVSSWARDAVAWCATNKVITGYAQDGRVDPQGSATRAQLAKIVTVVTRDVL